MNFFMNVERFPSMNFVDDNCCNIKYRSGWGLTLNPRPSVSTPTQTARPLSSSTEGWKS